MPPPLFIPPGALQKQPADQKGHALMHWGGSMKATIFLKSIISSFKNIFLRPKKNTEISGDKDTSVYVIHVAVGYEEHIINCINRLCHPDIKKAFSPVSAFGVPVFPGYVFVKMPFKAEPYYAVLKIPGVHYFLSPDFGVFPIEGDERKTLDKAKGRDSPVGALVKVVRGEFEGAVGVVEKIDYPYARISPQNFSSLESPVTLKVSVNHITTHDQKPYFSIGQPIRVVQGEYAGMTGEIEDIELPFVILRTEIFGEDVKLKAPVGDLEKL